MRLRTITLPGKSNCVVGFVCNIMTNLFCVTLRLSFWIFCVYSSDSLNLILERLEITLSNFASKFILNWLWYLYSPSSNCRYLKSHFQGNIGRCVVPFVCPFLMTVKLAISQCPLQLFNTEKSIIVWSWFTSV